MGDPSRVGPRAPQRIDDLPVGAAGEALLGEGGAQSVAAEALESLPILGRHPAAGVEGEAGQLGSQGTGLIGTCLMILLEPVQLIRRRGSAQRLGQGFFHGGGRFQQRSAEVGLFLGELADLSREPLGDLS
jgi:hypothetical protein